MATRFHLPAFGGRPAPPISPTQDAGWTSFPGTRILLKPDLSSTAVAMAGAASPGASGGKYVHRQFVSIPLLAQTISGTVKGMIRVQEINLTDNYSMACSFRVLSNDGATVRGTMLTDFAGTGTEFPLSGAPSSVKCPPGWAGSGTAITSVDSQPGDRLVLELGWIQASTSTANAGMSWGDAAAADLGETEGETAASNSWLEFSSDIAFAQEFAPESFYYTPQPAQVVGNQWGYAFFTLPPPDVVVVTTTEVERPIQVFGQAVNRSNTY